MAAKETPKKLSTIDDLAKKLKIDKAVLEAVKVSRNWGKGKEVSEEEFKKAVEAFLNAPADGRKTSDEKVEAKKEAERPAGNKKEEDK